MFFVAYTAYAQGTFAKVAQNSAVATLVNKIMNAIVLPVLEGFFLFTMLVFIWGIVGFIMHRDDKDARKKGQNHMLWGAVGLFVMISAYGIIRVIANTIGQPDPFL